MLNGSKSKEIGKLRICTDVQRTMNFVSDNKWGFLYHPWNSKVCLMHGAGQRLVRGGGRQHHTHRLQLAVQSHLQQELPRRMLAGICISALGEGACACVGRQPVGFAMPSRSVSVQWV